jgi:GPH family glycoside/pentoside/hexuronide:cation symporter
MSELSKPRELHGFRLFGYSIGQFGYFLTRLLISVFAFQYYVYTVNLDAILASIGISINLILNAIALIIFGVIADNKKPGRFGKRRPFMLYGLPIWVTSAILIWIPPWYCPKNNSFYWPTALYFWIMLSLNVTSGSSIISAHLSMMPEQSQTYKNREKIAAWRAFFMITASILALLLPLMIQSILTDPKNVKWWEPSGKVILFYMPIIGVGFASFGLFSLILTFFSVDESFHKKSTNDNYKKLTLIETFRQMTIPAKDKKYRKFMAVSFFNAMASRILGLLVIPFLAFVLSFKGPEFFIYVIVSVSSKYAHFFLWKKVLKKYGLLKTYWLCLFSTVIASFLELIFLVEILSFELEIVLFVITIGTVLGTMYAVNLFTTPLASALIYEAAEEKNERNLDKEVSNISGSYFGIQSFILAFGQSMSTIMIGFILSGANEENPIIITITLASMGIFYFISLLFLRKINLKRVSVEILKSEIIE